MISERRMVACEAQLRNLLLITTVILLPALGWTADFTTIASGNWNSPETWANGTAPGTNVAPGDTVTIAPPHMVTTDAAVTIRGALKILGTLQLGAGLQIGSAATVGTIIFGAGSELNLNRNTVTFHASSMSTAGTSGRAWAKVTGIGHVGTVGVVYSSNFNLRFMSFQNSGDVFLVTGSGGATTGNFGDYRNVVFANTGNLRLAGKGLGVSGTFRVEDCDFRQGGVFYLMGSESDIARGDNYIKHSYFSGEAPSSMGRQGLLIEGCVFEKANSLSPTGGVTWSKNAFFPPDTTGSGKNLVLLSSSSGANVFKDNYAYTNYDNQHGFSFVTGSGGVGSNTVMDNVLEGYWHFDSGNWINNSGSQDLVVSGNLMIGSGILTNHVVSQDTGAGKTWTVHNNTIYCNDNNTKYNYDCALTLTEGTGAYIGSWIVYNNLVHNAEDAAQVKYIFQDLGGPPQTLSTGFNALYNTDGEAYKNIINLPLGDNLLAPGDSNFIDSSRNLAAWDAVYGSGAGTADGARALFKNLNGVYDSTTKTQIITERIKQTPYDIVQWVRDGFAPQNRLLRNSGYNGMHIGAVQPVAPLTSAVSGLGTGRVTTAP